SAAWSASLRSAISAGSPDGNENSCVTCTPTTFSGPSRPISGEIIDPASLPAAPYDSYPRRLISSAHAAAVRYLFQPADRVGPENPKPGSDGITRWNAGASADSGSVSGPMTSRYSTIEP